MFQRRPARQYQPQQRPRQQVAHGDRYLPPMPEMLQAPNQQPNLPRYANVPSQQLQQRPRSIYGEQAQPVREMPVVRAQGSEEGRPRPRARLQEPVMIPSPEEMGVSAPVRPTVAEEPPRSGELHTDATMPDWTTASSRMSQLGASYYRLERTAEGQFRFSCAVPHMTDPTRERHFEALAETEQAAIALALQQVEEWKLSVDGS